MLCGRGVWVENQRVRVLTLPFETHPPPASKNMVGLANLFADCPRLQRHAILVIVAGSVVVEGRAR